MIQILDPGTAEMIAAGEVIEHPASVVKELVENSLDAGAGSVEICVREGGKRSIRVTDNGCGIPSVALKLAFSRFATSKLRSIEELGLITSLGFRGEALPSIAAVSKVTLTSRHGAEPAAARIRVEGGKIFSQTEVGAPEGTEVLVEDLFYNTPGRLKFMRGGPRELARISALLTGMALAHPACSFTLISEGKTLLRTTGDGSLLHALGAIYGSEAAAAMLALEGRDLSREIMLSGFLSAPHFSRASRRWITAVVNGRVVQSYLLAGALERAYGGMLARGRHPMAVINLEVAPDQLDVNVHPAKSEIRFHRPETFNELVFRAARKVLTGMPGREPVPAWIKEQQEERRRRQYQLIYPPEHEPGPGESGAYPDPGIFPAGAAGLMDAELFTAADSEDAGISAASSGDCRLIGQFLFSYLVAQKGEELLLIDQHAAHERVIYHALAGAGKGEKAVQLTLPLTLELPPAWRSRVEEICPFLDEAGFKLELFGDNSYILRAVPFSVEQGGDRALYVLMEELLQGEPDPGLEERERILRTIACHRAIKAQQPLSRAEAEKLLSSWEKTPGAAYCPHGRPAVLRFHRNELDKGFQRKGGGR